MGKKKGKIMSGASGPGSMIPADEVTRLLEGHARPVVDVAAQKPVLGFPARELRLDLGCGQSPREGFEGVDLHAPDPNHRVNLFRFPWPFEDESVDELHCSHFVEHIPTEFVKGKKGDRHRGKDMFFAFFDECWRVLKPGGTMLVIVPFGRSSRAFQDPTHRRFIMYETLGYLSAEWRKANKLDHYRAECNFAVTANHTCDQVETTRSPEAAQYRFQHLWNVGMDLHATLKKLPKA